MTNDIFIPGEGYVQYSPEQIEGLRNIPQICREETKKIAAKELSENLTQDEPEEEEYLLGLA